jgi:beta-N-acetylhexosaminidase
MRFGALFQAVLAAVAPPAEAPDPVAALTPREKAALVVISGLPAPPGVGGVIVRRWDRDAPRPPGALVYVDQEGGEASAYPELPPGVWAAALATRGEAFNAGRDTGRALRRVGVHVDFAPVLDEPDGPLGARHFANPSLGVAFGRGLGAGGLGACAKHFPGLGSAPISTDQRPRVPARVRPSELEAFRASIRAGVPCVMLSHALYARFGGRRAIGAPGAYRLLRSLGFRGLAITDSLSIVRDRWPVVWAVEAMQAGADAVLFTSPDDARSAIRALLPLARAGALDPAVGRVLDFQREWGPKEG